jgi:hypothetical protein
MTAEPVARAVAGFRAWTFGPDAQLRPVEFGAAFLDAWAPGVTTAWCSRGHAAPDPGCTCGLHAHTDLPARAGSPWRVLGAVVLWGRVVVHEHGLRAEHGRPVALLDEPGAHAAELRRAAAEAYGIPLLGRAELLAYVQWHGDRIVPLAGAA